MFDGLFIVSIFGSALQALKEAFEPVAPAGNWANKELYYNDLVNGVPVEQRMKNAQNGRYRLNEVYPEPHRDPVNNKIVIENASLYRDDVQKYGVCQAREWMKQGRYNLNPDELAREKKRIKEYYDGLMKY